MIEKILNAYKTSTYDFRRYAYPQDPLNDLFDEWVDYYRLKWAIAKVLQPASIFEIGVRYGYSARTFLDAAPASKYVGLDADLCTFGGHTGALDWAKDSLKNFEVNLIRGNSQVLSRFPGNYYDLIHVDGQQDGDGTFHDLNLALNQGRFILIDGYFWTRNNFIAANEWLWLNKAAIEFAISIPGYAGEMLIKTTLQADVLITEAASKCMPIANGYDNNCHLADCRSIAQWRRSRDTNLETPLLRALADVAWALTAPKRVIDLGAGRGELSLHFAKSEAEVTSIVSSKDATALIEQTFAGDSKVRERTKIVCGGISDATSYDGSYDVAVASDIIEHLVPAELETFYSLVSQHLDAEQGVFVVHSYPNLWNYRYEHPRRQREAKKAGFWLPKHQRTYFERLMHINEQSPAVLKKQLQRHFPYVYLWFADENNWAGSLTGHYTVSEMRKATNLFAVASHRPINIIALKAALSMEALRTDEAAQITLTVTGLDKVMTVGNNYKVQVTLRNDSNRLLSSRQPYPVHFSYHWEDATTGAMVIYDGLRTQLTSPCKQNSTQDYDLTIRTPETPGDYLLKVLPVQEMVDWYNTANQSSILVKVECQ